MLGNLLKSSFSKKNKKKKAGISEKELAMEVKDKSQGFLHFISQKTKQAIDDFYSMKNKFSNLLETNYNLGLKHMDNGHINEAIFRFRFIKKFWPDFLEAHFQLAYCLILKNKFDQSKKILEDLIKTDQSYENDARELLNIIEATQAVNESQKRSVKNNQ